MQLRGENLIEIEHRVGKAMLDIKYMDCFVDFYAGQMYVQIDYRGLHYSEKIEPFSEMRVDIFIAMFSSNASRYFIGVAP